MNRFLLSVAAAALLGFASCTKENNTPDNCYEQDITGIYLNVSGSAVPPGQTNGSDIPDSERTLVITATACNAVKVAIGSTLGGFEADCNQSGTTLIGTSGDNNSNYTYDTATDQITIKYTASSGIVYNLSAKR